LPAFKIFYRIGMAGEKAVLSHELLKDAFYGISLSANVACFSRTWVSQFINRLGKPFFIDPVSYVFQFPIEQISREGSLKKSFEKLVKIYGEPIISASEGHQITLSDFDDGIITSMITNILNFQRNIARSESNSQKSLFEFGEWLDEEIVEKEPEFLVPPYFWFDTPESEWYDLNIRIMELSKDNFQDIPIYGVLCTNKEVLSNEEWLSKILRDFDFIDGILIWLSDFNEYSLNGRILKTFINFVQQLNREKDAIMMYGSYFSMIASKFGLNGMSQGVGISESKNVTDQPTGGTFSRKYYVPQAKTSVSVANAMSFYAEHPETICRCDICRQNEIHSSDDIYKFFDELTPLKGKIHYCLCRNSELEEIKNNDKDEIESILSSSIEFCEEMINGLYDIPYRHLARWLSAIQ